MPLPLKRSTLYREAPQVKLPRSSFQMILILCATNVRLPKEFSLVSVVEVSVVKTKMGLLWVCFLPINLVFGTEECLLSKSFMVCLITLFCSILHFIIWSTIKYGNFARMSLVEYLDSRSEQELACFEGGKVNFCSQKVLNCKGII